MQIPFECYKTIIDENFINFQSIWNIKHFDKLRCENKDRIHVRDACLSVSVCVQCACVDHANKPIDDRYYKKLLVASATNYDYRKVERKKEP